MTHDAFIIWSPGLTLEALEKICIQKSYAFFKENKTKSALALNISVRTLDAKLEKYALEDQVMKEKEENASRARADFAQRQRGNPPNNVGIPYTPHPSQIVQNPVLRPAARVPVESFANASTEQPMPVQERQEVQTMSLKPSPKSGPGKGR